MKPKILLTVGLAMVAGLGIASTPAVRGCEDLMQYGAVMEALPTAQLNLADAISSAPTTAPETPIAARFEMDDNGQLVLSVCTAELGLSVGAESNNFREISGGAESQEWCPECNYLTDAQRLSQAAEQLTLMSVSPFSLLDILKKAERDQSGIPFSITPVVRDRKAEFLVLVAEVDRVVRLHYDLMTGALEQPQEAPAVLSLRPAP